MKKQNVIAMSKKLQYRYSIPMLEVCQMTIHQSVISLSSSLCKNKENITKNCVYNEETEVTTQTTDKFLNSSQFIPQLKRWTQLKPLAPFTCLHSENNFSNNQTRDCMASQTVQIEGIQAPD